MDRCEQCGSGDLVKATYDGSVVYICKDCGAYNWDIHDTAGRWNKEGRKC